MPGQILGDRYEVEKQLGKKAGRWTLLARDLTNDTSVILKILFIDEEMHQDDLKLFKREIQTLQTIDHPATPQYLGFFEIDLARDGKALALIQSFMDGIPLSGYLRQGRLLNEMEARQIAEQVLQILMYLHNHQPPIVHRDIQPNNIMLSRDAEAIAQTVSLVDFGSVKSFNLSDSTSFTLVGTDGYIPPEQMGRRAVRASDLYSLGITLVTGLTGIEPEQMPRRGIRIDLPKLEQLTPIHPDFVDWLGKMSNPDLEKRFQSARTALEELQRV
jgi:serine/threonine protein kinase